MVLDVKNCLQHLQLQYYLFDVKGDIDAKKVVRAIRLGEEKYCAVSASLNAEISYRLTLNGEEILIEV